MQKNGKAAAEEVRKLMFLDKLMADIDDVLAELEDAASLMLANDLAQTLELASDRLLAAGYGLRELAFNQSGVRA